MSNSNPNFVNRSVLDLQISLSGGGLGSPILLHQGTGVQQVLAVDTTSYIQYERTATGDISVAQKPTVSTIRYTAQPNTVAIKQIAQAIDKQLLTAIILPFVLSISSVSNGFSYNFTNVTISKQFDGYQLGTMVEDFVYIFNGIPPQGATLAQIANATGGLVGAL